MPPSAKSPNFSVKSPVPRMSVMAATMRFLFCEIHLVVHPDLGAGHGDQAEHHDGHTAHHRQRMVWITRAELGRKPSSTAISAATRNTAVE